MYLPTLILRHRKENLKKCSLRGLEGRLDCQFKSYPCQPWKEPLDNYALLDLSGPPLSKEDKDRGLILIDATWRYAERMLRVCFEEQSSFVRRSIPKGIVTAYPRRQEDCLKPELGLASVEALYVAYHILGREAESLLHHYYWKEAFLSTNRTILNALAEAPTP